MAKITSDEIPRNITYRITLDLSFDEVLKLWSDVDPGSEVGEDLGCALQRIIATVEERGHG